MGQLRMCFQPVSPFEGLWSHRDIEGSESFEDLDPVVQSIVSLTISLGHKFVKQISAKVTNTLLL